MRSTDIESTTKHESSNTQSNAQAHETIARVWSVCRTEYKSNSYRDKN